MKKTLILIGAVLALSANLAFAGHNHASGGPSPKSEHEITVGNDKASTSGSTADDKTVKAENTHVNHGKSHKNN